MSETVHITRNNSQGLGFSDDPALQGFPLALAGDEIRLDQTEPLGYRLIHPSPQRVKPLCEYFGSCGGCLWQHRSSEGNEQAKTDYLVSLLAPLEQEYQLLPYLTSPIQQRRRVGLHARKIGKKIEFGFKARKSWDLVPIDTCLVAMPEILALKPVLITMASALFESPKSAPCFHLTMTDTGIDVEISGVHLGKSKPQNQRLNQQLIEASQGTEIARITLGRELVIEYRQPVVMIGGVRVVLPYASFLQSSHWADKVMQDHVGELLANKRVKTIADLFSGLGTFALPLAQNFHCQAYDSDKGAIEALRAARKYRQSSFMLDAHVRDLFRMPIRADELKNFDALLFDPPRAGAEAQSKEMALSKVPLIIAISCQPNSFLRDAKCLISGGYQLKTVRPIDQFLWSSHLELIASFEWAG
jgi:23S rRNA (uracil1939-C5)-methyltransferase